jgi:molybdopterin molybdotransferase
MLELEDALARILACLPKPKIECVPLRDIYQRIAAELIEATLDLPVFDNSSMDGYAVRSADLTRATAKSPGRLKLIGKVAAGETLSTELAANECVRLFTGSPLPLGADAIVMQEDTRIDTTRPNEILVVETVKPWENVRFRGEDVKRGTPLIASGNRITIGQIALLAAQGLSEAKVGQRPVVGLLATGSELQEPGQLLVPGHIYESNRSALAPLIRCAGGVVRIFPIVLDEPNATLAALKEAFEGCDLVLTCGGVSVGEMDFIKSAFEQLGGTLNFWKVAIKPGRPFVFGQLNEKFLFGLPGNPVSAFVTFLLLVRPALLRWQGGTDVSLSRHSANLAEPLANPGERRHFMRVRIDPSGRIYSAGTQASHALGSLATANGLVDAPPKTNWLSGERIEVLRWDYSG